MLNQFPPSKCSPRPTEPAFRLEVGFESLAPLSGAVELLVMSLVFCLLDQRDLGARSGEECNLCSGRDARWCGIVAVVEKLEKVVKAGVCCCL